MVAEHAEVQVRVAAQLAGCRGRGGIERRQRLAEPVGVAADERLAEVGLAGEVIVQRGLGDPEFGGDVGVAEPVEPAYLREALRDVQDLRCGVGVAAAACRCHQ